MKEHSEETLKRLKNLDSPTVSNAIERFKVRRRVFGYVGYDIRCVYPGMGSMVGYAVTCTADSTTEGREDRSGLSRLWEAVAASPKPSVLVIQDIGRNRTLSCHLGEVMATTAKALGAVGCVSDGGLRDIQEIEMLGDFQLFCPGFVVSHGNPVIHDVNVEVEISQLKIKPGDLLHGDANGLLTVPDGVAQDVPDEAERVRKMEAEIINFLKSPGFSIEALRDFQKRYSH